MTGTRLFGNFYTSCFYGTEFAFGASDSDLSIQVIGKLRAHRARRIYYRWLGRVVKIDMIASYDAGNAKTFYAQMFEAEMKLKDIINNTVFEALQQDMLTTDIENLVIDGSIPLQQMFNMTFDLCNNLIVRSSHYVPYNGNTPINFIQFYQSLQTDNFKFTHAAKPITTSQLIHILTRDFIFSNNQIVFMKESVSSLSAIDVVNVIPFVFTVVDGKIKSPSESMYYYSSNPGSNFPIYSGVINITQMMDKFMVSTPAQRCVKIICLAILLISSASMTSTSAYDTLIQKSLNVVFNKIVRRKRESMELQFVGNGEKIVQGKVDVLDGFDIHMLINHSLSYSTRFGISGVLDQNMLVNIFSRVTKMRNKLNNATLYPMSNQDWISVVGCVTFALLAGRT